MKKPTPLNALLQTAKLEPVCEVIVPMEQFPEMIELAGPGKPIRQFFRHAITERRAFYKEGASYRVLAS